MIDSSPSDPAARNLARREALMFSLVSAVFLLFQIGYAFENGDQLQYLLLPYSSIYPNFLPGDWFTWHTSHYHETYSWLVRGIHALTGEAAFSIGIFLVHFAALAAFGYSLLRLARALGYGLFESVFAMLLIGFVRETCMAGTTLTHGRLLPADLALPPFLLACAAWAEGRALFSGVWLGVSGFFHANFALLGPIVLGPLELERSIRTRKLAPLLKMALACTLIASPTLYLLASSFLSGDSAPAAIAITLFERSPHHYDLRSMSPADFHWPLLLAIGGAPAWLSAPRDEKSQLRVRLLVASLVMVGLATLSAAFHIVPLARIFAWRISSLTVLLLMLAFGHSLKAAYQARDRVALIRIVACLAAVTAFAREDLLVVAAWPNRALFALPALLPLALATFALRLEPRARLALAGGLCAIAIAWSVRVAAIPLTQEIGDRSGRSARYLRFFDGRIDVLARDRGIFTRVMENTPADARFLIPPGLIEFRMLARRSVFVDWKCAPMKGEEALEWKRRMLAAMGTSSFASTGYALQDDANRLYYERSLKELARLARSEGMTHVFAYRHTPHQSAAGSGLTRMFGNSKYVVFSVDPRPAKKRATAPARL